MSTDKNKPEAMGKFVWAAMAAALLTGTLAVHAALGQSSGSVTVDVRHCMELKTDAERRDCFGAEVDAVVGTQTDGGLAEGEDEGLATVRDVGTDDATTPDREAGTNDASAAVKSGSARHAGEERAVDERQKSAAADDEYFGTITAMNERAPNRYAIALDNGQIWEQVVPDWYPLRPGLEVRIYPSRWGKSYRLTGVGSSGYIQVRRVR